MNALEFPMEIQREASSEASREISIIASTAALDRMGDRIEPKGIQLERYRENPVVLWNHDRAASIARALDIGTGAGGLTARVKFPAPGLSADSDRVYGLVKEGILNSISVGARAIEWEWLNPREPQGGRRYTKSELLELSVVSVGANPKARIVSRDFTAETSSGRFRNASVAAGAGPRVRSLTPRAARASSRTPTKRSCSTCSVRIVRSAGYRGNRKTPSPEIRLGGFQGRSLLARGLAEYLNHCLRARRRVDGDETRSLAIERNDGVEHIFRPAPVLVVG